MRPTSATGNRPGAAGFTLLEILVVVAITGVVVALAAVNLVPSQAQASRRDAAAIALAVERARDAAWFGGRPMAVAFAEGRLASWRFEAAGWRPAPDGEVVLPPGTAVGEITADGTALAPGQRLVFLPDGLGVPFRIPLEARGRAWAIEGDAAGAVRLVER